MTYDLRKRGNSDIDTDVGRRPREYETAVHKPKAEPATGPPHTLRRSQPGWRLDLRLLATPVVVIGYRGPSHKAAGKITRAEKEQRRRDGIQVGTTGIAGGQRRQRAESQSVLIGKGAVGGRRGILSHLREENVLPPRKSQSCAQGRQS